MMMGSVIGLKVKRLRINWIVSVKILRQWLRLIVECKREKCLVKPKARVSKELRIILMIKPLIIKIVKIMLLQVEVLILLSQ
jgi:hypothetical protein